MAQEIDWKRVGAFLAQEARRRGREGKGEVVLRTLQRILGVCGEFSVNRKMCVRLGTFLLGDELTLIAPCCPDYTHEKGAYTFRGLGGGISLLAEKHITFLEVVTSIEPRITPLLLIADHEADDVELCRAVGKSRAEFSNLVMSTIQAVRGVTTEKGWQAMTMTECIPDLSVREDEIVVQIRANPDSRLRLMHETLMRAEMYRRIRASFTSEEMFGRTARTAAQYVALGRYASDRGWAVCNHTTTNLSWYLQADPAVFHNPVTVY